MTLTARPYRRPTPASAALPPASCYADGIVWAVLNLFFHGLAMLQVGGLTSCHHSADAAAIWCRVGCVPWAWPLGAHVHGCSRCWHAAGMCSTCVQYTAHPCCRLRATGCPCSPAGLLQLIWDERPIRFASEEQEQLWRYFNRRCGMGRLEMQQVSRTLPPHALPLHGCPALHCAAPYSRTPPAAARLSAAVPAALPCPPPPFPLAHLTSHFPPVVEAG